MLVVSVFGRTNYNVSLLCVFFFVHASVLLFHFFILMVLPVSYVSYVDILRLFVFPTVAFGFQLHIQILLLHYCACVFDLTNFSLSSVNYGHRLFCLGLIELA